MGTGFGTKLSPLPLVAMRISGCGRIPHGTGRMPWITGRPQCFVANSPARSGKGCYRSGHEGNNVSGTLHTTRSTTRKSQVLSALILLWKYALCAWQVQVSIASVMLKLRWPPPALACSECPKLIGLGPSERGRRHEFFVGALRMQQRPCGQWLGSIQCGRVKRPKAERD